MIFLTIRNYKYQIVRIPLLAFDSFPPFTKGFRFLPVCTTGYNPISIFTNFNNAGRVVSTSNAWLAVLRVTSSSPQAVASSDDWRELFLVNKNQIVRLYSRFLSLDKKGQGFLSRDDFLNVPELAVNPLGDRIVDAFFTLAGENEQHLNFRQFVRILAHFQPINRAKKNSLNGRKEKLKFAFQMYDLNKNGYITREEFKVILNSMVGANITAEQLDKIADRTIEEADGDNDGRISFDEFCRAMEKTDIEQKMSIRFLN